MLLLLGEFVLVGVGLADLVFAWWWRQDCQSYRRAPHKQDSSGCADLAASWVRLAARQHVRMQRIVGFRQACHLRQDVTD